MNPDDQVEKPDQAEEAVPQVLAEWRRQRRQRALPWWRRSYNVDEELDAWGISCSFLGLLVVAVVAACVALAALARAHPRVFLWAAVAVLGVGLVAGVVLYRRRRRRW